MILHGDCLEQMKTLPDNSIDAVVTDPPYFLTNGGGSGFMGKEWDSLSVANAFAEAVLRSLNPVWLMDEASIAQEPANTCSNINRQVNDIRALFVAPKSIGHHPSLNLSTFSVQESVLTKAEVLALSNALLPSLTSVFASQPENVLYVVPHSFTGNCPRSIAQGVALRLVTKSVCEDLETLHSLMADQKTKDHIVEKAGKRFGLKFTSATNSSVQSVESIVLAKRYNATTLCPIESQKIIRWLTSLRYVRSAMATFTAIPGNIQLLSERFHYNWVEQVLRVLKPGGHLLSFGGTRTYHRMACAIEDAGFEIRDQVQWIYGSGFPKSQDISKAIDKQAGAERKKVECNITAPTTDAAKQWQGWGTALKPANEPICLARKPIEAKLTVADNVIKHGTGGLNIDASRIAHNEECRMMAPSQANINNPIEKCKQAGRREAVLELKPNGRWPANVLFDEAAAAVLDEQSGEMRARGNKTAKQHIGNYEATSYKFGNQESGFGGDTGGASRFFYVAKASKSERNAGLEGMLEQKTWTDTRRPNSNDIMTMKRVNSRTGELEDRKDVTRSANHHPTVKPVRLMEYLIKLICPPGGTILDPFAGSGSTLVAAKRLGFKFLGIELNEDYIEIANKRLAAV